MNAPTQQVSRPTRLQALLLTIGCVAAPIAFLGILYVIDKPVVPDARYLVKNLEYVVSHSATPPVDRTDWKKFDRLIQVPDDPFASIWVRADVKDNLDPSEANSFYLPFPLSNIEGWFEGEQRYVAAPPTQPLAYFRSPLIAPIGQFDPHADEVMAYLRVTRSQGYLAPAPAYIGPHSKLQPFYEYDYWISQTLPKGVITIMLTMIALVTALFIMRPTDTAYGWYALFMLLWAAHTAHVLVDHIPIDFEVWMALNYLCLSWIACEIFFINRFFDFKLPHLERFVGIITLVLAAGVIAVAASDYDDFLWWVAATVWLPWTMILSLVIFGQCILAVRRKWSVESAGLLLVSCIFIAVGARDYNLEFYGAVPGTVYYLQFMVLIPLLFFGFMLLRRHIQALRTSEVLNTSLEERVAAKASELEDTYRRLNDEEKKREIAEERARLMRDMHDGLGGQLVHALSLAESTDNRGDLTEALRYALSDLRLVVDSLAPSEEGIASLIANYRHRVSKSVARAGIDLVWTLADDLDRVELRSDHALALLRIIQEATTNALKHSKCQRIEIAIRTEGARLIAEVIDDGCGLQDEHHGHGLNNMRVRAQAMNAGLDITALEQGTQVRCTVPLVDAASDA